MNTRVTVTSLWVGRAKLGRVAAKRDDATHSTAADAIRRESHRLGEQLLVIDNLVEKYAAAIAEVESA